MNPIKCVIFDMDGTVANTLPMCIEAFRRAVKQLTGKSLSDTEITDTFGPSEEGTIAALLPEHRQQGLDLYLHFCRELHPVMCPAPFPGIADAIALLREKGVRTALVTGKGRKPLEIDFAQFGAQEWFEHIETGNPLYPDKPAGIEKALSALGTARENALYVGDTASDVDAAKKAGIAVAAAAWAESADIQELEKHSPDMLFLSVNDFLTFLQQNIK